MNSNGHSTTTELTSSWASGISAAIGLSSTNKVVEILIRAVRPPSFRRDISLSWFHLHYAFGSTLVSSLPVEETAANALSWQQVFFSLNLAFNALMWALFTSALTRASSTTRVSIINTSANFMLTAFSGWMVFGEKLPGLWWVGAAGLVVGNVVIGRRDEEGDVTLKGRVGEDAGRVEQEGEEQRREGYRDREGEEDVDVGRGEGAISDGVELDETKFKR